MTGPHLATREDRKFQLLPISSVWERAASTLQLLDQAMQRLKADPNADPEAVTHVEGSMRHALYGRASMKRDIAYEEGQGNVTAAWLWAQQQLDERVVYPKITDLATAALSGGGGS